MCIIIEPWKGYQSGPAETERQQEIKQKIFQLPKEHFRSLAAEALPGRTHTDVQTGTTCSIFGQPQTV